MTRGYSIQAAVLAGFAGVLAAACGSSPTTPGPGTPALVTLQAITISGLPAAFAVEETAQLTASASYSDGTSKTVTSNVNWSATSASCSVASGGLLTAVAEGDCGVEAVLEGVKATASVKVGPSKFFTISGVVREKWSAGVTPVPYATVELLSGAQAGRQVTVGADGVFSFNGVPREPVQVRARGAGFESNTMDVAPSSPSAEFALEPEMVIEERRFVPLSSWEPSMYQVFERQISVTRRGSVTVRLSSNQVNCEISYSSVFHAQMYRPASGGTRILDLAVCPPGPSVEERTVVVEPGSYTIYVGVMNSLSGSTSPYRDVYLRYPR